MPAPATSPLRFIGLARAAAGTWFVVSALRRIPDTDFLVPQAGRLLTGDLGGTDAPIRALFELLLIPAMLSLGIAMLVRGVVWMRRTSAGTPAPLDPGEVASVLTERRLPAYETGALRMPWPLGSWLADELGRLTGWRRDLIAQAARSSSRAIGFALLVLLASLAVPLVIPGDVLGPLPLLFVLLYPFAAVVWVSLALLLIGSEWPRREVLELSPVSRENGTERLLESPPVLVGREPPALGTAIAAVGVVTQCALVPWWTLDTISYPLLATSIIRHLGAIGGGVLFFVLGSRMIHTGVELLRRVQYDSVVVQVDGAGGARGAEVRTESRDPDGERRIIAAVGNAHARDAAVQLLS